MVKRKDLISLVNKISDMLVSIGGNEDKNSDFVVNGERIIFFNTKYGELRIHVDPDDFNTRLLKEPQISAMCRFMDDNPEVWREIATNKFSGKWNHHAMDEEMAINFVKKVEGIKI